MFNRTLFIVNLLLAVLLAGTCTIIRRKSKEISHQTSLLRATTDSVHYYRDHYGRQVAQKRAIEADLSTVREHYRVLTANQRALTQDVQHLPISQQKRLVTASSVKQTVRITAHENVDSTTHLTHRWSMTSDTLRYTITVHGDTLRIDSISIPNRLVLTHYRDSKDVLHVTAVNTNPMFKSLDVDAIVPPQNQPSKLPKILFFGAGIAIGILLTR